MEKGKLIVIEGSGDGIGKSTQVGLLRAKLDEIGVPVITSRLTARCRANPYRRI